MQYRPLWCGAGRARRDGNPPTQSLQRRRGGPPCFKVVERISTAITRTHPSPPCRSGDRHSRGSVEWRIQQAAGLDTTMPTGGGPLCSSAPVHCSTSAGSPAASTNHWQLFLQPSAEVTSDGPPKVQPLGAASSRFRSRMAVMRGRHASHCDTDMPCRGCRQYHPAD